MPRTNCCVPLYTFLTVSTLLGVLQNSGVNSDKGKSDIALFSKLISDTSSNINLLIDSLPTVNNKYFNIHHDKIRVHMIGILYANCNNLLITNYVI